MTDYHHSVSNRLILDYRDGSLHYAVCNKSFQTLVSGIFELIDESILDDLLQHNNLFNHIFASVQVVCSSEPFTLIPSDVSDDETQEKIFCLNHKLSPEEQLVSNLLNQDILLIHRLPAYLKQKLSLKFPIATFTHSCEWFYRYITAHNKSAGVHLYFQPDGDYLNLIVIDQGRTILVNQVYTTSDDELFFEVMALIEQLDLDVEELNLVPAGYVDTSVGSVEQFRNYVRHLANGILSPVQCNGKLLSTSLSNRILCG